MTDTINPEAFAAAADAEMEKILNSLLLDQNLPPAIGFAACINAAINCVVLGTDAKTEHEARAWIIEYLKACINEDQSVN